MVTRYVFMYVYMYTYTYVSLIDEAYVCEDGSTLLTDNGLIVACPSLDNVLSRTSLVSGEQPTLSSAVTIELHNSIYEGNYTNGEMYNYERCTHNSTISYYVWDAHIITNT